VEEKAEVKGSAVRPMHRYAVEIHAVFQLRAKRMGISRAMAILGGCHRKSQKADANWRSLDSASKVFTAFGENSEEVIMKWKEEFRDEERIALIGNATKLAQGRGMAVEVLPSGAPQDQAVLSVTFIWEY
jgi:hypothetical protein